MEKKFFMIVYMSLCETFTIENQRKVPSFTAESIWNDAMTSKTIFFKINTY